MVQLLFSDLVDFVLLNKADTFAEYADETAIAVAMYKALQEGLLWYSVNENDMICAMIMAQKDEKRRVIYVKENLSMNLKNLKAFARRAKEEFQGYNLEWQKHGIYKRHNTALIYDHLTRN